jgi:anti-sigma regulatory factor (Ser/Thr protein kinase)
VTRGETLPNDPTAARARLVVRDVAAALYMNGAPETAAIIVSELATNAVLHGEGSIELRVVADDAALRIEVSDEGPNAVPSVRAPSADPASEGGRGLRLVDLLATRWGVELLDDRKVVWAEIPCR